MQEKKRIYKLIGFINFFDNVPDFLVPLFKKYGYSDSYYFMHTERNCIEEFIEADLKALLEHHISIHYLHGLRKIKLRNLNLSTSDFSIGMEVPYAVQLTYNDIIFGLGKEFVSLLDSELEQFEYVDNIFCEKVADLKLHYHFYPCLITHKMPYDAFKRKHNKIIKRNKRNKFPVAKYTTDNDISIKVTILYDNKLIPSMEDTTHDMIAEYVRQKKSKEKGFDIAKSEQLVEKRRKQKR